MSNLTHTTLNYGSLVVKAGDIETFTFTATSSEIGTVKAGTILARDTGTGKLVVYEKAGTTAGNGEPNTVLMSPLEVDAAGDFSVRCMTEGSVRKDHLVIAADGNASSVDYVEEDGLRGMNITVVTVHDNSVLDNHS